MKIRKVSHQRKTKETDCKIDLTIEGTGKTDIKTPVPFLSHILDNFARHGAFDLKIRSTGDIEIDQHHTVEDMGIALGEAFEKALGDKKGINRAGYFIFPMDEALALVAVDISGRMELNFDVKWNKEKIGDLDSDLIIQFFFGFCRALKANLHARMLYGKDEHHKAEVLFKAFGKAMKMACSRDKNLIKEIPSTKGKI